MRYAALDVVNRVHRALDQYEGGPPSDSGKALDRLLAIKAKCATTRGTDEHEDWIQVYAREYALFKHRHLRR